MRLAWGVVLIVFTFILGWLGQAIVALWPKAGERLGLSEPQSDVDPTFFVDIRGEALWDAMSIWPMPVAGILLLLNHPAWAYFGLIGGGMYVYFAGRGIVVRLAMQRHGVRIGKPGMLTVCYAFLTLYELIGVITIVMAVAALPLS